jgi:hypothetical protein
MNPQDDYVTGRRGSIGEYVCDDEGPNRTELVVLATAFGVALTVAGLVWKILVPSTTAKINRRLRVIDKQRETWQKAA